MGLTGIVRSEIFLEHDAGPGHPECPDRLRAVYRLLDEGEWPGISAMAPRPASMSEITRVHTEAYYRYVADTEGRGRCMLDPDTATCGRSFEAARVAVGGLIDLTDRVISGELANGFALVRPPGHHAESDRAMGFCLFNNVALAAAHALDRHGMQRVMIVDWDLHHGNGTQNSFYDDPRVLYFSTHQYPFYPGSGGLTEKGRGAGLGYTVNVPLSRGRGDDEYLSVFQRLLVPLARAYRPQLILVSAGFDAYRKDPLGEMLVTDEGYAAMTRILKSLAGECCAGRLVLTLEGGYHLDGAAAAMAKVIRVLAGQGQAGRDLAATEHFEASIVPRVREAQSGHWRL